VGSSLTHHNEIEDFVRQAADTFLIRVASPDPIPIPFEHLEIVLKISGVFVY
jgi:hypothetical protein